MRTYREQKWGESAILFGRLGEAFPEDGPTQVFLKRAREFAETPPPPGWEGVYVMKSK